MDEARIVKSGEVITAEELYFTENVAEIAFCCDECEITLVPCSYIKDVNLRKPYFKTLPNQNHKTFCEVDSASKVKNKGRNSRLTSKEGFPLAYPNRFKLRKENVVDTPTLPSEPRPNTRRKRDVNQNNYSGQGRKSNYETSSFKSIVNEYFDFPHDRDRAISFEGIEGDKYNNIFKSIQNTIGKQQFNIQGDQAKIYYATLSWKIAEPKNDILKIELTRGKWINNKNQRPYYVEVNMSDWPNQSKTKFVNRYKDAIHLVRGTENKAVVAFVGIQDTKSDFFRFYATNRLLIAFKLFYDV